ncbi:PREDICTED: F-box/LRR-repeat protein At5g63520-like [Populus euphratica]|uniref:F-box/LRR-repeat protein At5g63520-like n=1 Tax=Populus euphratica TaxID=75702 RepID=A0AAJ6X1S7_POPEU|nr:PREDICTED: F-box/LRR-repeat protein At5g63520-like [Populus euphratica]
MVIKQVALQEVASKVLSEPIRPQFAIANVIESGVDLSETLYLLAAELGSKTPIIVSCANGIIGRDAVTGEHREVMLEDFWADAASKNSGFGMLLTVGYLPGLKVEALPLLRPREAGPVAMIDNFVVDIKNYSASVSGSTSPALIIMFGGEEVNLKPVMEKLDHAMSREAIIAGNMRSQFLYRKGIESRNIYGSSTKYFTDAVALVFARDEDKPSGEGKIQFHSAISSGVSAIGPRYKAVSVKETQSETGLTTWLTARREGEQEILGGQMIIDSIDSELVNKTELFIGVSKQRQCVVGSENPKLLRSLALHQVKGGDGKHLFVSGDGIGSGDYFHFYHSDPKVALSSCSNVSKNFRNLKLDWRSCQLHAGGVGSKEVVGGLVFSCWGRGESFFGHSNVDSSPFLDNLPGIPMAGIFGCGEVGRGFTMFNADDHEDQEEKTSCSCLHVYSTVYVLVSYTPAFVLLSTCICVGVLYSSTSKALDFVHLLLDGLPRSADDSLYY